MTRLLVLLLLLTLPLSARPPVPRPVNNPRPGQANPIPAKRLLLAKGRLSSRMVDRIIVDTSNGTKLTFLVDQNTKVAGKIEPGVNVVVSYDGTLESGVFKALIIKRGK